MSNNQPYIFISYSHKDRELISPFISALNEKYVVWFDEGINYRCRRQNHLHKP